MTPRRTAEPPIRAITVRPPWTRCPIAVAALVDCHPDTGCCPPWGDPDAYHLTLHAVRLLPRPIPTWGALGVWTPPPQITAHLLGIAS